MMSRGNPIVIHQSLHEDYNSESPDPYQSVRFLGHGGGGSVDEVVKRGDRTAKCYARKQVRLLSGNRNRELVKQLQEEAQVIRHLRHHHVIQLVGTYTWNKVFGIIIDPVAETDLQQFLSHVDSLAQGTERDEARARFLGWTLCLIRGLDYIHEMRVKHRDIKPSNILIKQNTVYFTDFGISRILPAEFTTGTEGIFGPMTRAYIAPEALQEDARRGRALDIFSLGCVLLEMGTVLIGPPDYLERFRLYRHENTGSIAYAANPPTILQWVWNLWGDWYDHTTFVPKMGPEVPYLEPGTSVVDLAFMMLDPDPNARITTGQLLTLISSSKLYHFQSINLTSTCNRCRMPGTHDDGNLPLHSVFKSPSKFPYPNSMVEALNVQVASDWEDAKHKWLQHHMWW